MTAQHHSLASGPGAQSQSLITRVCSFHGGALFVPVPCLEWVLHLHVASFTMAAYGFLTWPGLNPAQNRARRGADPLVLVPALNFAAYNAAAQFAAALRR